MLQSKFTYLDKKELDFWLTELFDILYSNMSLIAPTGCTYEEDFAEWKSNVYPAMQKEPRQIILMYVDQSLVGYFQYYVNAVTNALMMEEIQIKKELQKSGLFTAFYQWLVKELPREILYVEAYADKKNERSQGILKHLGLAEAGENKSGSCFYFKGPYGALLKKYL